MTTFEKLSQALDRGTVVTISVEVCEYKCCGGGWKLRMYRDHGASGLPIVPQTYTGRLLSVSRDEFMLQVGNQLGKMAEVIGSLDRVTNVD